MNVLIGFREHGIKNIEAKTLVVIIHWGFCEEYKQDENVIRKKKETVFIMRGTNRIRQLDNDVYIVDLYMLTPHGAL